MNINQATDYAFRAVLFLSKQPPGMLVEAQTIAKQEVIPMRFLLKLMPSLIKAGLIKSQRGVGGGYSLAKSPQEITLYDVLEAMEGPVHLNRCLENYGSCSKNGAPACRIHQTLANVQSQLVLELQKHNFGDLLK
ncbi:MAG: RrF2 family transcriptional regulator [Carboxydocellales bacterium]